TYSLNDIESIRFNGGPQSSAPGTAYPQSSTSAPSYPRSSSAPAYPQSSALVPGYYPPTGPANASGPDTAGVEIPAGTQIVVRMIDGIDSTHDSLGQTFRASVDQPVTVNGQTVVPRGSDVVAALIDASKS